MSINILDLVRDQVSGTLANQASQFLGESESGVAKALGGLMPAVLGGAIEKVSNPGGGQGLMDLIGGLNLNKLSDISGIFQGGASEVNNVMNKGGGIIDSLLGTKASGVIDMIAGMSGLKKNSTGSLLKIAAPLLLSVIGKQIKGKGVDALKDLIMSQKDHVAKALPAGMGNLFGFAGLGSAMPGVRDSVMNTATATTAPVITTTTTAEPDTRKISTGGILKWIIPLLLLAALAFWFFNKGGEKVVTDSMETVEEVASNAADAVGDVASDAANATVDFAKNAFAKIDNAGKEALDKINFTTGSVGAQMMNYINGGFEGDGTFQFKNLNFPTGSASLSAEGQAEVDNLAAIMKAYPGVKVEIHGHTDNVGEETTNKTLSSSRAGAVMGRLIAQGIDAYRVKALGYGSERPVADNDTAEGRAQNRRIEVKIVE